MQVNVSPTGAVNVWRVIKFTSMSYRFIML